MLECADPARDLCTFHDRSCALSVSADTRVPRTVPRRCGAPSGAPGDDPPSPRTETMDPSAGNAGSAAQGLGGRHDSLTPVHTAMVWRVGPSEVGLSLLGHEQIDHRAVRVGRRQVRVHISHGLRPLDGPFKTLDGAGNRCSSTRRGAVERETRLELATSSLEG